LKSLNDWFLIIQFVLILCDWNRIDFMHSVLAESLVLFLLYLIIIICLNNFYINTTKTRRCNPHLTCQNLCLSASIGEASFRFNDLVVLYCFSLIRSIIVKLRTNFSLKWGPNLLSQTKQVVKVWSHILHSLAQFKKIIYL
jgi:hypothetical protein